MPCVTGRSKHALCKPTQCSTEEKCPCTVTDAYSCQRSCEPEKCICDYLPREAFGRIIAQGMTGQSGVTGAALDPAISNIGIESVTPLENGSGFTGAFLQINFNKGLFDRCPTDLPPVISVTPCRSIFNDPNTTFAFSSLNCEDSTTQSVVVSASFDGDLGSDSVVSFDFRAVQAPRKHCC